MNGGSTDLSVYVHDVLCTLTVKEDRLELPPT